MKVWVVVFKDFTNSISTVTFSTKDKAIAFAIDIANEDYKIINYPLAENGCTVKTCEESIEIIKNVIDKP